MNVDYDRRKSARKPRPRIPITAEEAKKVLPELMELKSGDLGETLIEWMLNQSSGVEAAKIDQVVEYGGVLFPQQAFTLRFLRNLTLDGDAVKRIQPWVNKVQKATCPPCSFCHKMIPVFDPKREHKNGKAYHEYCLADTKRRMKGIIVSETTSAALVVKNKTAPQALSI